MTSAELPHDLPGHPWSPLWRPDQDPVPAAVTLVCTPRDDRQYMSLAFAAHQPRHGRITVHPTPVAANGFYLAHDLLRAYGKHLPVPGGDGNLQPTWTTNTDDSWRFTTAWTMALGIAHLTVCRAHTLTTAQWYHLLALSACTGAHLTMLCNGPLPHGTQHLLTTVAHRCIQDPPGARAHWHHQPGPEPGPGRYPWWTATAAFPPLHGEVWLRLPPQPASPRTTGTPPAPTAPTAPEPAAGAPTARLPVPTACQGHDHPHIALAAGRIHTRIAHPAHAATAALRVLNGYTNDQVSHLHSRSHRYDPTPEPPRWAAPLIDAALHLAELRGHRDTLNPVATPGWEHPEIDQALRACRLLPSPPARKPRTTAARTGTQTVRRTPQGRH